MKQKINKMLHHRQNTSVNLKDQALHTSEQRCHAHYDKKDPERSVVVVKAFRWNVWPKICLLARTVA